MFPRIFLILSFVLLLNSCSKDEEIYKPTEAVNPFASYKEGLEAFENNNFFFANKKYSEAELNFEVVELAANLQLCQFFSIWNKFL